jgi:hypothetical protein
MRLDFQQIAYEKDMADFQNAYEKDMAFIPFIATQKTSLVWFSIFLVWFSVLQ